jgi:hypothetical protein
VEVQDRIGWLSSGRFIRALAPIAGLVLVAVVLYNATAVDRVPPTYQIRLSALSPDSNLALTRTSIDVVFSEQVKRQTAEAAFSIGPNVAVSPHWQGLTLILTPSAKLPLSTTFKVHMAAGVQDLAGNSKGKSQDLTFTTVGAPTIQSVAPAPKEASVPVDTAIQVTFDRYMDSQKVLAGLTIVPDAPFTASWNGPTLSIVPNNPLSFATTYTIKLGDPAVDTDGTPLAPYETTFTTVGMGLRVNALIPAANVAGVSVRSPIAVVFDGPIDPSSIADAIHLTPPVSGKVEVMTLPDDRQPSVPASPSPTQLAASPAASGQNVLVFTPDSPLASHTTYTASMSPNVRRTDGEAATAESWTFTTGEPPTTAQNQIVYLSDRGGVANVWVMNPDGSNQHEVTAELVPVSGFDVSGDGNTIAYAAGGVVKRMAIDGDNVHVLTAAGAFDYAPEFTPDGTAIVVGRRDPTGADQGYWRIPIVSGVDPRQVSPDGAPGLGSVALHGDELTGSPGETSWAPRAAFSADGNAMLLVRGNDNAVELVDMTGVNPPQVLGLTGNSRPIWDPQDNAFYVVASTDRGATWSCFQVTTGGATTRVGAAAGDLTVAVNGNVAFAVQIADGSAHLVFASSGSSATSSALTSDPTWSDGSPSFSPDGSLIVFGRFGPPSPTVSGPAVSGGIWVIGINGSGLTQLATDGAYPLWLP